MRASSYFLEEYAMSNVLKKVFPFRCRVWMHFNTSPNMFTFRRTLDM